MFKKFIIDLKSNLFDELSTSTKFEDIAKGRQVAVLVNDKHDLIPIIRTTTVYNEPAQKFLPIHHNIMDHIRKKTKLNITFNNASIEIYDFHYRNMKFHTDQSLDLKCNSYICLFSCYENDSNNSKDIRKLQIQNKITKECSEISLDNGSIVLFSTSANHEHLHKIILESNTSTNKWLGITFRLSKTFIKFNDNVPYIYPTETILRIATNEEKKNFFKHKGNENLNIEYTYPEIDYTISISDTLFVI